MSDLPWFQFFPSDWLAGTRGLSVVETGVYITLIATMYDRAAPLADTPDRLARLCGASLRQFTKALESLLSSGKILRSEGGLWNDRVAQECKKRMQKSDDARKAAQALWEKKNKEKQCVEDAAASNPQSGNDAIQKPDTIRRDKNPSDSRRAKRALHSLPDGWVPSNQSWHTVRDMGFSEDDQNFGLAEMRDWAIGSDARRANWDSVYCNWFRRNLKNGKVAKPQRNTFKDGFAQVDAFYEGRQRSPAGRGEDGSEADHGELPRLWESAA